MIQRFFSYHIKLFKFFYCIMFSESDVLTLLSFCFMPFSVRSEPLKYKNLINVRPYKNKPLKRLYHSIIWRQKKE